MYQRRIRARNGWREREGIIRGGYIRRKRMEEEKEEEGREMSKLFMKT